MTRNAYFDSPFLLGFEPLERLLERTAKSAADSYPPYNIEATEDGGIAITLAVAGFARDEISVTVEDRQLTIAGRRTTPESEAEREYLHRGIAARGFVRSFVLADGMEVEVARLEHGLLHIDLTRPEPEGRVKRVPIVSAD